MKRKKILGFINKKNDHDNKLEVVTKYVCSCFRVGSNGYRFWVK